MAEVRITFYEPHASITLRFENERFCLHFCLKKP